jgi:hypothetical protein
MTIVSVPLCAGRDALQPPRATTSHAAAPQILKHKLEDDLDTRALPGFKTNLQPTERKPPS